MSSNTILKDTLREAILAEPDAILDDKDLMQALVTANEQARGNNVIDLRGIAMQRLEARLDRLEDTHRSVIAAAYENLAGTNQVHRAILRLLEPVGFEEFLQILGADVADILRVERITLVLETTAVQKDPAISRLAGVLAIVEPGFVDNYLTFDHSGPAREVVLREIIHPAHRIFGSDADHLRSEACLRLDLGEGRLPGMIIMSAKDPRHFTPKLGTDLLTFFAGVFERSMRHWLS
ncbi:DUF484 family protein [Ruegeria faecimaris]|uniref:DUF484 domain-containing protein n=1 Tax=Ruegeria faecimaris TaxID=686389 RepID=A0A521FB68_9RHOB|nr:DUF484 family protein [Ruegeria faecimaris]SMO93427.1 hypothetical protein SAMN06265380_11935 [Ruegeria faecimaris]